MSGIEKAREWYEANYSGQHPFSKSMLLKLLNAYATHEKRQFADALADLVKHDTGCVVEREPPAKECCAYCRARLLLAELRRG